MPEPSVTAEGSPSSSPSVSPSPSVDLGSAGGESPTASASPSPSLSPSPSPSNGTDAVLTIARTSEGSSHKGTVIVVATLAALALAFLVLAACVVWGRRRRARAGRPLASTPSTMALLPSHGSREEDSGSASGSGRQGGGAALFAVPPADHEATSGVANTPPSRSNSSRLGSRGGSAREDGGSRSNGVSVINDVGVSIVVIAEAVEAAVRDAERDLATYATGASEGRQPMWTHVYRDSQQSNGLKRQGTSSVVGRPARVSRKATGGSEAPQGAEGNGQGHDDDTGPTEVQEVLVQRWDSGASEPHKSHPSAHDAGYGVDGASVGVPSSVAGLSMDRRGRDRSTKSHRKKEQARSLFSLLRRMSLGKASDPGSDTADEIEREVRECLSLTEGSQYVGSAASQPTAPSTISYRPRSIVEAASMRKPNKAGWPRTAERQPSASSGLHRSQGPSRSHPSRVPSAGPAGSTGRRLAPSSTSGASEYPINLVLPVIGQPATSRSRSRNRMAPRTSTAGSRFSTGGASTATGPAASSRSGSRSRSRSRSRPRTATEYFSVGDPAQGESPAAATQEPVLVVWDMGRRSKRRRGHKRSGSRDTSVVGGLTGSHAMPAAAPSSSASYV